MTKKLTYQVNYRNDESRRIINMGILARDINRELTHPLFQADQLIVSETDSAPNEELHTSDSSISHQKAGEFNNSFSQEMLDGLLKSGQTKNSIARQLHISTSTINRILRGEIRNPSLKTFSKLLAFYCATCYNKFS